MHNHNSRSLLPGFLFVLLALAGCRSTTIANWQHLTIQLDHAGCIWLCPEYRLTISGDGTVVYQGLKYVAVLGEQKTIVSPEQVQALVSEFEKADFYTLADNYVHEDGTDQETVITSIAVDDKSKTVKHYHGDLGAPRALTELENKIDVIVESAQWVK